MDPEAERQGEILAFYGEEETRNYDSPEPGPAVEKDDTPVTHQQAEPANGQVWVQVLSRLFQLHLWLPIFLFSPGHKSYCDQTCKSNFIIASELN